MAKKTNEEIGAEVRAKIVDVALETYETVKGVKVIINIEVEDDRGKTYSKGSKGITLTNYDADDEELTNTW